ncbi:MAG: hypothetical protein ACOVNU_13150 [Candidatus Kapaibacteriota bacterium]|jgi:hypothetical protein
MASLKLTFFEVEQAPLPVLLQSLLMSIGIEQIEFYEKKEALLLKCLL